MASTNQNPPSQISKEPLDPRPKPRPKGGGGGGSNPNESEPGYSLGSSIKAKWQHLGGLNWARPDDESGQFSMGGGSAAQFFLKNGSLSLIVSSSAGTHEVSATMDQCWVRVGQGRGPLGFPTSDSARTHDGVGWYQLFQGGTVVWHPKTGVFETHGDINAKYGQKGGSRFGYPTTDETATADGNGRFNHFLDPATGANKSIYWTNETKAVVLEGDIRNHYVNVGLEGVLGLPTSDANSIATGGQYQLFQQGTMVWHPQLGAFETHGTINAKYAALGGSSFGYPITDETATPDRVGRFNHFRDVATGQDKSIYWTPDLGALAVVGPIRDRWASLGWERSHLGYPTSDQFPWPEGGPNSVQQTFQGGRIVCRNMDPQYTVQDPIQFEQGLSGGSGFGGKAAMTLYSDGRVRFFGETTNGAYQDYDYSIYALVRSPLLNLAMRKSGEINMKVFGRNKNRWSEDATHGLTNGAFAELSASTFEVHNTFQGGITGKLSDVLSTLGAWTITAALGPGVIGIIYAGIELGAVISGGSFEAGPRIMAGTMWMLGPEGFLVGMAVDALARIGTNSRGLNADEKLYLGLIFDGSIDLDRITLTDTMGKGKRAFTFPSPMSDTDMNLNLGHGYQEVPDKSNAAAYKAYLALLAHEATHAWQYRYMANHSSYVLHGILDTNYEPGALGKKWHEYNIEQQATIVERWAAHFTPGVPADGYGLLSSAAVNDKAFDYILKHIRIGRNR
jgi:LGFP repeat